MTPFRLDRRSLLRGAAGFTVALPWLEIMDTRAARAAGPARRYLVSYCGVSIGGDEDKRPSELIPNTVGPNYDLKTALAPFGPAGAQPYISVVSGLRIPERTPDGFDMFHGGIQSALLTGVHESMVPPNGNADTVVMGTSSDQVVADAYASLGLKYKHVALKVQAGFYNMYNRITDSLCFRLEAGSPIARKVGMQSSPKAAYDGMFAGFVAPSDPGQVKASDLAWRKRKSVIDFVADSARRLRTRLGAADQQRLDRHLYEIGELGKQVAAAPKFQATGTCSKPDAYAADPPVGANYGGEDQRAKLMCDLMYLAFACDMTRVGTLLFTHGQCNMSMQDVPGVGYASSLHQASHFGAGADTNHQVAKGISWHMKHFGALVKRLADTPDAGGGSIVDNLAGAFLFEGGQGPGGNGKLTAHSGENMAVLVAGRAGGLKAGQHVVAPAGTHPVNVLISCMNAAGVPTQKLGNVSGEAPGLR